NREQTKNSSDHLSRSVRVLLRSEKNGEEEISCPHCAHCGAVRRRPAAAPEGGGQERVLSMLQGLLQKVQEPPESWKQVWLRIYLLHQLPPRTTGFPNHCNAVCRQLSICGMAATTDAAGVDACVAECTNNHGTKALPAAVLD
ncbi:hypothetical protein EJB05_25467, partial [Eragrostis curvula]